MTNKGLFPATVLAELERRYLGGESIAGYFDLVAGTSTGGIIALGLGAGLKASELADVYERRGAEIFPEPTRSPVGRMRAWWRAKRHYLHHHYERDALQRVLTGILGDKLLGDSMVRLCSLGCGEDPYVVSQTQMDAGGKLAWSDVIFAAMRLQSLAAVNQARLLLGPPAVRRIDPPANPNPIMLDDFGRSLNELVPAGRNAVDEHGARIAGDFLASPADRFVPVPPG